MQEMIAAIATGLTVSQAAAGLAEIILRVLPVYRVCLKRNSNRFVLLPTRAAGLFLLRTST